MRSGWGCWEEVSITETWSPRIGGEDRTEGQRDGVGGERKGGGWCRRRRRRRRRTPDAVDHVFRRREGAECDFGTKFVALQPGQKHVLLGGIDFDEKAGRFVRVRAS